MGERITLRLHEPVSAHKALGLAWLHAKAWLVAGHRLIVEIRPETRSDAQNRLLHSRLGDIAKQIDWVGKRRGVDVWKRLLMAAWLRARGEHVEILPALDGHGVDVVFERTSKLSRSMCAEFSEYIMAWGEEQGVKWCAASLGAEWAGIMLEAA